MGLKIKPRGTPDIVTYQELLEQLTFCSLLSDFGISVYKMKGTFVYTVGHRPIYCQMLIKGEKKF